MRHAALNRSGPVSPRSKGATVMPSGRRAESLSRLQDAQIIAAHSENVEGVELDFMVVLAGVQRVKVADDIHPKDHGLSIYHKPLLPVLQCGLSNPGMPPGPVGAVAREEAHAVVLPDKKQPVAVVLHLMNPVRS